jgi:hypothetical protein
MTADGKHANARRYICLAELLLPMWDTQHLYGYVEDMQSFN